MQDARQEHMTAALHTLKYIHRNPGMGILFNSSTSQDGRFFVTRIRPACPCTGGSISSSSILLGGSPIS